MGLKEDIFIYKRKSERMSVLSLFLNTETSTESLCLRQILPLFASKIYPKIKRNPFYHPTFAYKASALYQLRKTELKNNFSLNGNGISTSAEIKSFFYHYVLPFFTSELPRRGVNMETADYIDNSVESESNILTLKTKFEERPSESNALWAKKYIAKNRINHNNFKTNIAYISLSKSKKKRAIYDQINLSRKKSINITKNKRSGKELVNRGSLPSAILKMITALIIEKLILSRSFMFFTALNFSFSDSILSALAIELCYMITSAMKGNTARALNIAIYLYSAFTICFSSYISDSSIQAFNNGKKQEIKVLESKIERAETDRESILLEKRDILEKSNRYTELGVLTHGENKLLARRNSVQKREHELSQKLNKLEQKMLLLKNNTKTMSTFTLEKIKLIGYETHAVMAMFLLLQVLSAYLARSSFETLGAYVSNNKRSKRKK
jgi:hypothetical protein